MTIVARYVGDRKSYYGGVPRRDLTELDWQRLDERRRALVRDGALYRMVGGRADRLEQAAAEQQEQDAGAEQSPPAEGGE